MTVAEALALLAAAVRSEVEVREPADGGGAVVRGSGAVESIRDEDGALVLRERGAWRRGDAPTNIPYSDALRFRRASDGAALEVAHLRRGDPVPLVTLRPHAPGRMRAESPHHCGADEYSADLERVDGGLRLRWRVHGPAKDQEVVRTYRDASADPAPHPPEDASDWMQE